MELLDLSTPQAIEMYNLLHKRGPMSAKEIANALRVTPNVVYRALKPLQNIGLVVREGYPAVFTARNSESAVDAFLMMAKSVFIKTFHNSSKLKPRDYPVISYINDRDDLLERTNADATYAHESIDFLISGLVVPDATFHIYRKKVIQGVKIRALLQKREETPNEDLEKWSTMGVDTRLVSDCRVRLFILDKRVVYFTSYDQKSKQNANGIRFEYPALASFMSDYFEQLWSNSTSAKI